MKLNEIKLLEMQGDFLTDKEDIVEWLKKNNLYVHGRTTFTIENSKVNLYSHNSIVLDRFTILHGKDHLPIQFKEINCALTVKHLNITSFKGFPEVINGELGVSGCHNISSMEGFPKVADSVMLSGLGKLNLEGLSNNLQELTEGNFSLENTTIIGGALGLILIKGLTQLKSFHSDPKQQEMLNIIRKYLGRPDDIFDCQNELIENGFEEQATV